MAFRLASDKEKLSDVRTLGAVRSGGVSQRARFGVRVRPAAASELDAVLGLWRRAGTRPSVSDDAPSLRRLLSHDPEALLVAELGGQLVGSLIAGWDGWRGNLYRLAVDPLARRRGVARALVAEGERRLSARGCQRIHAGVLRSQVAAEPFWTAATYERTRASVDYARSVALAPRG